MTPEIARLAKEAGIDIVEMIAGTPSFVAQADIRDFEMFVHLIAEACAKEAEFYEDALDNYDDGYNAGQHAMVRRIRSKFPTPTE